MHAPITEIVIPPHAKFGGGGRERLEGVPRLRVGPRLGAETDIAVALTGSCGRLTVATFLALRLKVKVANVEQRLYAWCLETDDKAGTQRQSVDVIACQHALLRWIVRLWSGTQLAITNDATSLGSRFVALVVCVVYRGIGIPVAWTILPAGQKKSWRPIWLRMLRQMRPAIPRDWTVIVLADRGIYTRWLFRRIVRLGWHPFLRINTRSKFRPAGKAQWYWLSDLVGAVGQQWQGRGTCFKDRDGQLECTFDMHKFNQQTSIVCVHKNHLVLLRFIAFCFVR